MEVNLSRKLGIATAAALMMVSGSAAVAVAAVARQNLAMHVNHVTHAAPVAQKRPVLSAHGYTLRWTNVANTSRYVLSTVSGRSRASYRLIRGTTFTPRKRPGQTVRFRVRANFRGAHWTRTVLISYRRVARATKASASNVAPVLSVTGGKISFSAQPGVSDFAGAISTASAGAAGRTTTYQDLGNVTSWSPPTTCGQTRYYGVASKGSAGTVWSKQEVSITWAACVPSRAKLMVSVESTVGVNSFQPNTASTILNAGVTWDRNANTTAARSLGFSNLVVPQDGPDGNCTGDSVSQVVGLATSQIPTMKADGQHLMELCNESYLTVSAQTYAQWYDAVHKALAGTGITLGANAIWGSYCGSAYSSRGCDWMGQVIAELARINGVSTATAAKEVDAWTIHPYAWPVSTYASYIKSAHDAAVADGSTAPWWVTETGICLDTCWMSNGVRSEQDQANGLTAELNDLVGQTSDPGTPFSWVTMWNWYAVTNTSDGQWGLMDQSCPSTCTITGLRPSYYALKTWMQGHAGQTSG
jgi:hypothetical protein